jgi:hypothetical protein
MPRVAMNPAARTAAKKAAGGVGGVGGAPSATADVGGVPAAITGVGGAPAEPTGAHLFLVAAGGAPRRPGPFFRTCRTRLLIVAPGSS